MRAVITHLGRILLLLGLCALGLQAFFALRIALMAVVDPSSTAFQRSEAWRLISQRGSLAWSQEWVPGDRISVHLKRAVIVSEDAGFATHGGVDWESLQRAWDRNQQAASRSAKVQRPGTAPRAQLPLVGGSTITQQLAKNLFLSGERTLARKAQELLLTLMLESLLSKDRLLEIYLNSVEWAEGVFGAQAAARHYHGVDASALRPEQAARLAVILPAPKRFERLPGSAYVAARTAVIAARMPAAVLPRHNRAAD